MKLAQEVTCTQEIKKSRFICMLRRVQNEEAFKAMIKEARKLYPQATHYCTACKIGSIARSSDDGEPAGTAGRPMLDVLHGADVDEIGAVVIRYFGGTLLGKGGLVRAYASSVKQALEQASFVEDTSMHFYQLRYDYALVGKVDGYLRAHGIEKTSETYGEDVVICVLSQDEIEADLLALSAGKMEIQLLKDVQVEKQSKSHI